MNIKKEERPCNKVKVRVRRAGENSRASAQLNNLSDAPDLIEAVLPAALDSETEHTDEITVFSVESKDEKIVEREDAIVFLPLEDKEEIAVPSEAPAIDTAVNIEEKETKAKSKNSVFVKFSEMTLIRKILTILCLGFCIWSLLPLIPGIIGIGLFVPLFIGLFALFTVWKWDFISSVKNRMWKAMWFFIAVIAMAGIVAFAFVSGHMISASNNTIPANNSNVTVVVLGCKVNGTEPSLMLQGRLDTAADYLLTHPGVNCIVTGGMGNDENLPEAVVMKQYLVDKGVAASRIKIDDRSSSTQENIENAIEVANANNYYTTFYIVTDRFHQLRAGMICKELGITSYALSCETPWYLTMNYWFREMFAIAYHTVTKN